MDERATLPGISESATAERIVLHVDLDCFYAACERLREPALNDEPVVVGMGYEPGTTRGAVATASYEAREHGIESAQSIEQAIDALPPVAETDEAPAAHYRPVDMDYYESVSDDVGAILDAAASTTRHVSVDEAYLDVTDRTDWADAAAYAADVKAAIEREIGLTASVGVAPTMHAAKVASDHDKPDGLVVVDPGEVQAFLADLPIEDLHGVGPVTARTLRSRGIETIGALAAADRTEVATDFGERGETLHRRARGIDRRPVEPRERPKSLSRESAFAEPTETRAQVESRLRSLAEAVADRARSRGALYRTVGIKIIEPPYDVATRERSLPGPVDEPSLVTDIALSLFEEFAGRPVRKVGVRVSKLAFAEGDQASLDTWSDTGDSGEVPARAPSETFRQTTLPEFCR